MGVPFRAGGMPEEAQTLRERKIRNPPGDRLSLKCREGNYA